MKRDQFERQVAAAKRSPEGKPCRETSLGDKAAAATKSSQKGNREGRQGNSGSQEQKVGDKAAAAAQRSPEGKSGRETIHACFPSKLGRNRAGQKRGHRKTC